MPAPRFPARRRVANAPSSGGGELGGHAPKFEAAKAHALQRRHRHATVPPTPPIIVSLRGNRLSSSRCSSAYALNNVTALPEPVSSVKSAGGSPSMRASTTLPPDSEGSRLTARAARSGAIRTGRMERNRRRRVVDLDDDAVEQFLAEDDVDGPARCRPNADPRRWPSYSTASAMRSRCPPPRTNEA